MKGFLLLISTACLISGFAWHPGEKPRQYDLLNSYLEAYKKIAEKGGWKKIGRTELKPGEADSCVRTLKARLYCTGEYTITPEAASDTFDAGLETAVKQFQQQHHLPATGIADEETMEALNIPVDQWIRQIELNMGRWRNMPDLCDSLYIFVNIAAGDLEFVENDSSLLSMKVIVGRSYRETPVFNAELSSVELNPYWVVPPGIMENDLIPQVKKMPSYIKDNDMYVLFQDKRADPDTIDWNTINSEEYKVIRNPGPENPMGTVKFVFPNTFFVYMHDTPSKELFDARTNTFSSGCIRLSKAEQLAAAVLNKDRGWTESKTDSLIRSGRNRIIPLKKNIKIYITYFTAWVNDKGQLEFAPDIYKRDL